MVWKSPPSCFSSIDVTVPHTESVAVKEMDIWSCTDTDETGSMVSPGSAFKPSIAPITTFWLSKLKSCCATPVNPAAAFNTFTTT